MGEKSTRSRHFSGGRCSAGGSANFIDRISSAETTNEKELTLNTVCRPKLTSTMPPSAAPSAKLMDHVAEDRALAAGISSPLAIFGITALRAGSNIAQQTVSIASSA